jgi:peptidyl-prolyl cis-trans isomerase C
MPHGLRSSWRDLTCRVPVLAAAGCLLAAAGPAPTPARDNAPQAANTQPGSTQSTKTQSTKTQAAPAAADSAGDQTDQAGGPPLAAPTTGAPDPVVASVEGHLVYLSDLGQAEQALPPNLRNVPFDSLYPVLLDRMVDHEALVMLARRRGLEDNPAVKKQIEQATERVLEGALLGMDAAPKVTEAAIKARYGQLYANRPATEQVRARHILVSTEAEADKLIAELKNGGDFATLAKQYSKDPDGQKGGDLGFFSREQVWPGFADVAFALQPGQVADQPIHNEFGWHVVKVEERRLVAPPSYSDVHDALRQQLLQEAVRQEVALARGQLTIHEWNLDGSSIAPGLRLGSVAEAPK